MERDQRRQSRAFAKKQQGQIAAFQEKHRAQIAAMSPEKRLMQLELVNDRGQKTLCGVPLTPVIHGILSAQVAAGQYRSIREAALHAMARGLVELEL